MTAAREVLSQVSAAGRIAGPHSPFRCHSHNARPHVAPRMLEPRASDDEIASVAQWYAGTVRTHLASVGMQQNTAQTSQELQGTLNGIAVACGVRPVAANASLYGVIQRMIEPHWWRRGLRRNLLRENEDIEHAQGAVRKSGQCYVTDWGFKRTESRDKASRAMLENTEVVNELGQAINLAVVADASVSNPKHRRSELLVRCRGFEETAKFEGHVGVFLTITCPSRFHKFAKDGKPNPNWAGATARDGQAYLNEVWRNIGRAWAARGIRPYGFRVAEPHHDGCPHWHLLLFVPKGQLGFFRGDRYVKNRADFGAGMVGIAGGWALRDTPKEPGANRVRFTAKRIDPYKGSATGYIAKYISKNIDGRKNDGSEIGPDLEADAPATVGSQRVRVWARLHGIRQFQQVGGPSVTVYRELRRLGKDRAQPLQLDLFELPRAAADRGLWSLFWVLQGGPDVPRSQLNLRPMYVQQDGGKYGDVVERVKGVKGMDFESDKLHELVTREHEWTVQRAGLAAVNAFEAERKEHRRIVASADKWAQAAGFASVDGWRDFSYLQRSEASTWTGVNNCPTDAEDEEAEMLQNDFLRGGGGQPFEVITYGKRNHGSGRTNERTYTPSS